MMFRLDVCVRFPLRINFVFTYNLIKEKLGELMKFIFMMLMMPMLVWSQETKQVQDWDVTGLRAGRLINNWSFDVEENWVTRFLKNGGDKVRVTGLKHSSLDRFKIDFKNSLELKVRKNSLPVEFDWRNQANLQPVRTQGNCGSCWSFATTAVLESLLIINGHDSYPDLAEQTMVSTCSNHGDCRGGYFEAFDYMTNIGLVAEYEDPYLMRNSVCRDLNFVERKYTASWMYITNNGGSPTIDQIKQAILDYGPVSTDIVGSFPGYRSGIYNRCSNRRTDHMVNIIGWSDYGQYWIVRNSWGAEWGEQGHIRIKYENFMGRKCNGVGTIVAAAVID